MLCGVDKMFATPRSSVTLGVLSMSDLLTGQSKVGVREELEKLAARSTNTHYENTLRKLFEEKLKEEERGISKSVATEHAVLSPSSSPSKKQEILNIVRSSVNQNGARARATSSSSPSSAAEQSARVAQLSQPLERNKWSSGCTLQNPNSAFSFDRNSTNHLGRQRPPADAPAPVFRARSPSPRADRSNSSASAPTDLSFDAASSSSRLTVRLCDFRQWVRKGERWQEDRQRRIDTLRATLEDEKKKAAATAPPPSSLSSSSVVVISPRPAPSSSSARRRSSSRGRGKGRGVQGEEEEEAEALLGERLLEGLLLDSAVAAGAISLDAMVQRLAAKGLAAPSEAADAETFAFSSVSASAPASAPAPAPKTKAGPGAGTGPVRSLFPRRSVRSLSPSTSASEAGVVKAQTAKAKAAAEREEERARLFSPRIDHYSRQLAETARARHDAALLLLASQGQARGRASSSASSASSSASSASEVGGRGRPARRVPSQERLGFGSSSPRRAALAPLIRSRSGQLLSQASVPSKDLITGAGGRRDVNNDNSAAARGLPSPGSPWYSRPRSASPASSRAASASEADARPRSSSATPRPKTAPPPPVSRPSRSGSSPVLVHTSYGSELIMANKTSTLDERLKESVERFLIKRVVADRMARAGAASPAPGQYSLKSGNDVAAGVGSVRSRSSSPGGGVHGARWGKASRQLNLSGAGAGMEAATTLSLVQQ